MLIVTQPTNLGYLMIDNRASGDLPPGVSSPLFEAATYTCTHCQSVVVMNPERKRERYKCSGCSHLLCDSCGAKRAGGAPCRTWAQLIDEVANLDARGLDSTLILSEELVSAPAQAKPEPKQIQPALIIP